MAQSKAQQELEAGESVMGSFWPVGADFKTPGMLRWTDEDGAELRLADLSDSWPTDFNDRFAVHGLLHSNEKVTLMNAGVIEATMLDVPTLVKAQTLALGAHTHPDQEWACGEYRPSGLHEWYPETGLVRSTSKHKQPRPRIELKRARAVTVAVSGAKITFQPGANWTVSYSPSFTVETRMSLVVKPDHPLTIDQYWDLYGNPLLGFVIFASDRPDGMKSESFYNKEGNPGIVVLREGRKTFDRPWRPHSGHFLFKAEDVDSEAEVLRKWLDVWRMTEPALGLFCETIQQDNKYSPSRFLTLWTAVEAFWEKTRRADEKQRGIKAWVRRANIDNSVVVADKDAQALAGELRKYHAHLTTTRHSSTHDIAVDTFESTRRLQALLQACLLLEMGMDTQIVEALINRHYLRWPLP